MTDIRWRKAIEAAAPVALCTAPLAILFIAIPAKLASDQIKWSDFLGLLGNLLGASVTLCAAIIAWKAVKSQIDSQREEMLIGVLVREEDRAEQELQALRKCQQFLEDLINRMNKHDVDIRFQAISNLGLSDDDIAVRRLLDRAIGFRLEERLMTRLHANLREAFDSAGNERVHRNAHPTNQPLTMVLQEAQERTQRARVSLDRSSIDMAQRISVASERCETFRRRIRAILSEFKPG